MRQFAVFGLGIFGKNIALALYQQGFMVLAVDIEEAPVRDLASKVSEVVQADTTDEKVLEALGIRNFDVAIVSIGNDIQSSVLTTLALKDMGVPFIVARAINENHGKILSKVGADRVIFPEKDMAIKVAKTLTFQNAIRTEELFPGYNIVESKLPAVLANTTLSKSQLRNRFGVTILAIRRTDEYIVSPAASEILNKNDIIYVLGDEQQLKKFFRELASERSDNGGS
ncbi:MAG TPA: TrkA family potassium uptake protein [Atribacter sp.]|mgnify:FL=1|jgi:trk system potassium uptake protein TrkA|uniref:Ktr system potassium uptake protein A n=1 Tax=Candidatus Atribacter allofermentans TaxID=1852833 RepID=A0A1V5SUK8_9BACT|nr:TrkA family potassium uptake protein [Atribacter sp.]MDD3714559.1 TrkA family potassium uptake protein [Atribacterota bacterium]OQA57881.1 MAG: Ktr system potassium uptake protein A [Candidatus Atribacteria bacterium ADurb.Bin276]HHT09028.1 TrkA family potassium uptake protein [Candidatus Atribacteria bacterium]MDI9595151.1 TrkA family potassium uptake protein [Atribacterota bacterium]HQK83064.1 TrkA family potassium uptake protein [Atribacter sp.]